MTLNATGVTPDTSKRARRTMRFCLNLLNGEEKFIHDILEGWRKQRRMATNIRKAILLFADLAQGNTARLHEYFPHIVLALTGQAVQDHADSIVERVGERLDQQASVIQEQMSVMAFQARADGYAEVKLPPLLEEPPIKVTKAKKTSAEDIAANFFKSAGNLGFFD